jgi:hypothetical protein
MGLLVFTGVPQFGEGIRPRLLRQYHWPGRDCCPRIRLKYVGLVKAFLKEKQKAATKKQPLSPLHERAIKQAEDYGKLVFAAKKEKNDKMK